MHAKDLGYQLVIGRNERWISHVWVIQSPVRVAGYFRCMPAFLGRIQWEAGCPQQLAPNSWQLLHLPLRRVPALHQGLVSCLKLPWRMTLMISRDSQQRHPCQAQQEGNVCAVQVTAQKWVKPPVARSPWIPGGLGGPVSPTTCPQPQHRELSIPTSLSSSVQRSSYIQGGLMPWTCECLCVSQTCW